MGVSCEICRAVPKAQGCTVSAVTLWTLESHGVSVQLPSTLQYQLFWETKSLMFGPLMTVPWWLLHSAAPSLYGHSHSPWECPGSEHRTQTLRFIKHLPSCKLHKSFIPNVTVPAKSFWTPGNEYLREPVFPLIFRIPRSCGEHCRSPREGCRDS